MHVSWSDPYQGEQPTSQLQCRIWHSILWSSYLSDPPVQQCWNSVRPCILKCREICCVVEEGIEIPTEWPGWTVFSGHPHCTALMMICTAPPLSGWPSNVNNTSDSTTTNLDGVSRDVNAVADGAALNRAELFPHQAIISLYWHVMQCQFPLFD